MKLHKALKKVIKKREQELKEFSQMQAVYQHSGQMEAFYTEMQIREETIEALERLRIKARQKYRKRLSAL